MLRIALLFVCCLTWLEAPAFGKPPRRSNAPQVTSAPPQQAKSPTPVLSAKEREAAAFQEEISKMIIAGEKVAKSPAEKDNVRALKWHLREYEKYAAVGNWKKADAVQQRMQVSYQRGEILAADAPRRAAVQEAAEKEQKLQEEKRQQEERRKKKETLSNRLRIIEQYLLYWRSTGRLPQ